MNIIKLIYKRARAARALQAAINKAEEAYVKHGTKCYVILSEGRLAIIDHATFRKLKARDSLKGIRTMADVERQAIYYTSQYRGNLPAMPRAMQKERRLQLYRLLNLTLPWE